MQGLRFRAKRVRPSAHRVPRARVLHPQELGRVREDARCTPEDLVTAREEQGPKGEEHSHRPAADDDHLHKRDSHTVQSADERRWRKTPRGKRGTPGLHFIWALGRAIEHRATDDRLILLALTPDAVIGVKVLMLDVFRVVVAEGVARVGCKAEARDCRQAKENQQQGERQRAGPSRPPRMPQPCASPPLERGVATFAALAFHPPDTSCQLTDGRKVGGAVASGIRTCDQMLIC
jgi:hypothetical protein